MYALVNIEQSNPFRWTLGEGTYVIGRRDDCDFQLSDLAVSRTHAAINISANSSATITDLNSSNGVFLNGRRIVGPTPLPVGSLLGLGPVRLLLVDDSTSPSLLHNLLDLHMDIDLAARMQRELIDRSPAPPDGFQLAAHLQQCSMVGGDVYDIVRLDNERTAIMIGDAVGHGIGAAILMSHVLASFRTQRYQTAFDPQSVASIISRLLFHHSDSSRFITAFLGVLESGSGQLRYVNAGHNSPIVVRVNGSIERLDATGIPVGVLGNSQWTEKTVRLDSGDRLFLFTDGLIETCQAEDFFGEERLIRVLSSAPNDTPEQTIKLVKDAIQMFAGDSLNEDDTTMIAIKRL